MNPETIQSKQNIKHRYEVLIEKKSETKFIASVLGWYNCKMEGRSKEEALEKLHQLLTNQLQNQEIVTLEVELPQTEHKEHPWLKFAGMFKDDPQFEELQDFIAKERQKLDEEMEKLEQGEK
jgi:predicted RNase H-like HicB family nuclease